MGSTLMNDGKFSLAQILQAHLAAKFNFTIWVWDQMESMTERKLEEHEADAGIRETGEGRYLKCRIFRLWISI